MNLLVDSLDGDLVLGTGDGRIAGAANGDAHPVPYEADVGSAFGAARQRGRRAFVGGRLGDGGRVVECGRSCTKYVHVNIEYKLKCLNIALLTSDKQKGRVLDLVADAVVSDAVKGARIDGRDVLDEQVDGVGHVGRDRPDVHVESAPGPLDRVLLDRVGVDEAGELGVLTGRHDDVVCQVGDAVEDKR
jgi:hypothetical protein